MSAVGEVTKLMVTTACSGEFGWRTDPQIFKPVRADISYCVHMWGCEKKGPANPRFGLGVYVSKLSLSQQQFFPSNL